MARVGLFEHLSVVVGDAFATDETRVTEADNETYDDDPSGTALARPSSEVLDQTYITRVENETYDDDPGLGGVGVAWRTDVETYFTKVDGETVDDAGSDMLSVPMS